MKADGPTSIPLQVRALLLELRQHPAFPAMLASVPAPRLPRYRPSRPVPADKAVADWTYSSGQADQHEQWLGFLRGTPPTSQQE